MSQLKTRSLVITQATGEAIDGMFAAGGYGSPSDVVDAGLRVL
ncbi:MAG: hypothetical protein JWQ72_2055 [Polaromonas sp.]|nr:hypothetical protein [Polaromonas sp.]